VRTTLQLVAAKRSPWWPNPTKCPQSKGSGPGIPKEVVHPLRGENPMHRSQVTLSA